MTNYILKPCPFCGKNVKLNIESLYHDGRGYEGSYEVSVGCEKCHYSLPAFNDIYEPMDKAISKAVKAWNRRAKNEIQKEASSN